MESSIIVSLSRQDTLMRKMDIVANNLANMNTTAFKAERVMFTQYLVDTPSGGDLASDDIAMVRDVSTLRDDTDGGLQETGGAFDVAIAGDGYFAVDTPLGKRYTRDGHFRLDEKGQLATAHGLPVLTKDGTPIQFGPDDINIGIGRDGTISSAVRPLGQLAVVTFPHPERIQAVSGGLFISDETPTDVVSPVVMQGMLEASNVQPIVEMTRMIDVQRAFDQAGVMLDREDDRLRKMLEAYKA